MCTLTSIPDNLGLGLRAKNALLGFQPYLHFLVNQVYLKVLYRAYKNGEEKWQLANDVLEIFYQIIYKYECQTEDFKSNETNATDPFQINAFKSPLSNSTGYRLLYDFIHDGPIVKMLFVLLNESLNYLLEFNSKNDSCIEQASLNCLKLISLIIERQKNFIDKMKMFNLNVESSGIEKLIVSINLNTNRAEYFMSIFRFIQFNSSLVNHSYYSLNIIYSLSKYSLINKQILNLFLKSCLSLDEQFELMHSFVEFLDFDNPTNEDSILNVARQGLDCADTDSNSSQIVVEVDPSVQTQAKSHSRLKALKLLMFYLRLPAPNISHLLLGFDIHKPLNNQQFYNPGTKINYRSDTNILSIVPRNCLHSVIKILNYFLHDQTILNKTPQTIELCYEIMFMLCSDFRFKTQILNYLRNEFDFVNLNLKRIPFKLKIEYTNERILKETTFLSDTINYKKTLNKVGEDTLSDDSMISLLSIYSWSLQLICIEIQQLISGRMKQQLKKLIQILTDNISLTNLSTTRDTSDTSRLFTSNNMDSFLFMANNNPMAKFKSALATDQNILATGIGSNIVGCDLNQTETDETSNLFYLLNFLNLSQTVPFNLELNFFDPVLIENVVNTCKINLIDEHSINVHLFDLKKLKQILHNEIKTAPPTINVSKSQLINELKYILQNVFDRNQFQLNFYYKKKYFDSFKLLVETLVQLVPNDIYPLQKRYASVYLMSKSLLNKVLNQENILPELTYQLSSLLFTLIVNLRKCVCQIRKMKYLSNINMSVIGQQSASQTNYINIINLPNLVDLFKKIVEYLLDTSKFSLYFYIRLHFY